MAVFTKVKPLSVKHDLGIEKHDQEGRILTIEFEQFFLVTVYSPNSGVGFPRVQYRTQEFDKDVFAYL